MKDCQLSSEEFIHFRLWRLLPSSSAPILIMYTALMSESEGESRECTGGKKGNTSSCSYYVYGRTASQPPPVGWLRRRFPQGTGKGGRRANALGDVGDDGEEEGACTHTRKCRE